MRSRKKRISLAACDHDFAPATCDCSLASTRAMSSIQSAIETRTRSTRGWPRAVRPGGRATECEGANGAPERGCSRSAPARTLRPVIGPGARDRTRRGSSDVRAINRGAAGRPFPCETPNCFFHRHLWRQRSPLSACDPPSLFARVVTRIAGNLAARVPPTKELLWQHFTLKRLL